VAQARGLDLDHYLSRPWLWFWHVLDAQRFHKVVHHSGFHDLDSLLYLEILLIESSYSLQPIL
jgi:hypothetical protein